MVSLNTIRLVKVSYESTGAEKFRADADAAAASQTNLGQAAQQTAVITEESSRRQLSAATAYAKLQAAIDPVVRAQMALERSTRTADRALAQGIIGPDAYGRTLGQLEARFGSVASSAQRSAQSINAAWRDFGAQGSLSLANIEASRRIGGLGPTGAPAAAANQNNRLRADQVQNLAYQGGDILSSLGSGSNLSTVAFQQGPQIAQIFGGPGGASVKGALAQAGEAATGLASRVGLVGGAIGGVTAIVGLGAAALASYSARQRETEQAILGVGRASGATLTQINAVADANARAGRVSVGSAREYGATYAGTGRIGADLAGSLITTTRDFAKVSGQDASAAAKELAEAFADPAKGADALNARLGFLSDGVRENVRRLTEQGDRLGAQRALFSAYRDSVEDVTRATSGWSALTAATGEIIGNTWDKIGRNISKGIFGGTIDQELAKAQERLSRTQVAAEGGFGLFSSKDIEAAQKDVDRLGRLVSDRNAKIEQAQRAQRSLEIGGTLRSLLPEQQELERLTNQVERVRKAISDPIKFGLDGSALGQAEAAFGRIGRLLQTMNEDVGRFGTTAAAALNRTAEFNNRTVGYTPYGRSAADINEKFVKDLRERGLDPNGRSTAQVESEYRTKLGDSSLDLPDRYNIAQRREEELRTARELEGYRRARDLDLNTLQRTETLSLNPQGGAFSTMSAQVQQQVLEAGKLFGQVPAAIIAAVAKGESGGNANIGFSKSLGEDGRTSSAFGLGQITRGTAADAIRRGYLPQGYDRTDTETMAQGIAGVLKMKLDDVGGDMTKALEAYRGSSDPSVNRAYAATALRNAGQLGDASASGLVRDQDALARSQRDAGQQLENITQNYGRNGLALDTLQQRQAKYTELLDRGVGPIDAASVAFGGLIDKTADFAQRAKLAQFSRDDDFAREQLGRSATDQRAYATARGLVGDTSTDRAQGVIERSRATIDLADNKAMITDGVTSFATALRRGGDAATALSDAFGNAADRLLSKALDSVISQGFGMLTKGGGGIASLFGFADGGFTGHGGRNEPAGIVHRGEYVFDASATRRIGIGALEAMRGGLPGYVSGGLVGSYGARPAMPVMPANGNMSVVINNNGAPVEASQSRVERGPDGSPRMIVDIISRQQAGEIAAGRGALSGAVAGGRRLRG